MHLLPPPSICLRVCVCVVVCARRVQSIPFSISRLRFSYNVLWLVLCWLVFCLLLLLLLLVFMIVAALRLLLLLY